MTRSLRLLLLLSAPLLLTACDTAQDEPTPDPVTDGVLVANQGTFGNDDGALLVYDPEADSVLADPALGGFFFQSAILHDGLAYLTTANSVEVVDPETYEIVRSYTDVPNPRYVAFAGDRAFVTNLYTDPATFAEGGVTVLDMELGTVADTVILGGNPDGIAAVDGRVYVANYDYGASQTVTVLDAATAEVVETIDVGCDGPRFLFVDEQDEVLAFCTGATDFTTGASTNGQLVVLEGATGEVVGRVELPTPLGTASSGQLADYADEAEEAYAAYSEGRTVYRFDTATNTLDATLDVGGAPVNAVAYDAVGERLYLGRLDAANPYTSEGVVTLHERGGAEIGRFDAGVVPSHVAFRTRLGS